MGREPFLREVTITTANLRHLHILPLFDSGEAGEFLFYSHASRGRGVALPDGWQDMGKGAARGRVR